MQTVDSLDDPRREEARRVIESYESIMADPFRMATISSPLESMALFKLRCRALRKQYGIRKEQKKRNAK